MYYFPASSRENLDLYVAWFLKIFFYVEVRTAEAGLGLCTGSLNGWSKLSRGPNDSHSPASTAEHGLDKDWESNPSGFRLGKLLVRHFLLRTWYHRNPGVGHDLL